MEDSLPGQPRPDGRKGKRPQRPVAVALHYELGGGRLPKVAASGRGCVAEQILNLAFANGVRVREDADLAEILAAVDIECDIPVDALAAVAEILVHVYRANGELPKAVAP